jgi:hypothetical protein
LYVMFSRATRVFAVPTNSFGFLFARLLKDGCSAVKHANSEYTLYAT